MMKQPKLTQISVLRFLCFLLGCGAISASAGTLEVAPPFGDNLVLQHKREVVIRGHAPPRERVSVQLGNVTLKCQADSKGQWDATIPRLAPGGPLTLVVSSQTKKKVFENILVGEVWLALGDETISLPGKLDSQKFDKISRSSIRCYDESLGSWIDGGWRLSEYFRVRGNLCL